MITKAIRTARVGIGKGSGTKYEKEFQRNVVEKYTGVCCPKTNGVRIHSDTGEMKMIKYPYTQPNGFEFTEDFDGVQEFMKRFVFINFKCIVGHGGSQTDRLKSVYQFIKVQKKACSLYAHTYFANILDGDESNKRMLQFDYLDVDTTRIYIGTIDGYFPWLRRIGLLSDMPTQMESFSE